MLVTKKLRVVLFSISWKKSIQIGLEQLEGEQMTIFIFGWTILLMSLFYFL